eukprot:6546128-Pyramimonas_sp.AAC.1
MGHFEGGGSLDCRVELAANPTRRRRLLVILAVAQGLGAQRAGALGGGWPARSRRGSSSRTHRSWRKLSLDK